MKTLVELAAQCHARLTAPGAPFELTEREIAGQRLKAYKNAFPTLPALIAAGSVGKDRKSTRLNSSHRS